MNYITFSNVDLKYEDKTILEQFNLNIQQGEKVLIRGKSGKGKSTLFRLLLGFESVDDGEILVDGVNLQHSSTNFYDLRQQFAYVDQDVTLRQGIVNDILMEIAGFSGNQFQGKLDSALMDTFDFEPTLLNKDTRDLSGGERQRLGLLIAIMLQRPIYLLDEVTSGLDEELKTKVVTYFAKSDQTVIVISHDNHWLDEEIFRKVEW